MVDRGWFQSARELPVDFTPRSNDVICSRGAESYNHEGNRRFRSLIDLRINEYKEATSKIAKTTIVSEVVDTILQNGSLFVRQNRTGHWSDVGDKVSVQAT